MAIDWGASGRVDAYSLNLVDPFTLEVTGTADFDPSGSSVTWADDSESGAQASIALVDSDWMQGGFDRLLQLTHTVTIGGESVTETLGTFFVDSVTQSDLYGRETMTANCYSAMWRYTQDCLDDDLYIPQGAKVLPYVAELATAVGGVVAQGLRAAEGDQGAASPCLFAVGDNRAEVMRTIAAWVGCEVKAADDGRTSVERILDATEREPVYEFEAGETCTYLPGREWDDSNADPVNRVVAWWSRDSLPDPDDGLGYTKRCVVDLDANAQFSYARCGRRRTHALEVSNACTQAELEAQARRYLRENSGAARYVTIEHVGIPHLRVGDVVTYKGVDGETALTCQVSQMSVGSLAPWCQTQTKLRVVE